jgi:DUF1365 family protein
LPGRWPRWSSRLLAHADGRSIAPGESLAARKVFHVSPFFEVRGGYRFRFEEREGGCHAAIDYDDDDGRLLATAVWGRASPLNRRNLLRAFLFYPWMTLGVIARIHMQALRLWMKGVKYVPKPLPPAQETTR